MGKVNLIDLKIPNLGDAEETEIIEVNVSIGSRVYEDDPLIVLESEKAAMEIPSEYEGKIVEIKVSEGQSVQEGQVFAVIECDIKPTKTTNQEAKEGSSYSKVNSLKEEEQENKPSVKYDFKGINAGPAVRKYARELEIDLSKVSASGRNRKITKQDLINFIHSKKDSGFSFSKFIESDFKSVGNYKIEKLSKIRQIGAKNLHKAWLTIPHVTHFDEIDMSNMNLLKRNQRLSPLSIICECFVLALKDFPIFNSSLIGEDEILIKEEVNLGIAVDTEHGLVVPVIKNAEKFDKEGIMKKISELAEKARNKKLLTDDLSGATATISSLGKFGGVGFTPIINPPEVCILAVSRSKNVLALNDKGDLIEKELLPVALSYDHRVINGADAGRFMEKFRMLLEEIT